MANRYFNKQTTNARQALAQGGRTIDPRGTGKSQKPKRKGRPSLGDDAGPRRKLGPKGGPRSGLEKLKKKQRQADYMKKHGKKAPRRKTLSVTNSYKKEVEGLK